MADHRPSEISPLLSNPSNNPTANADGNDSANDDADILTKQVTEEENQEGEVDRDAQFEGLPEVKAKLKYIVPAVAIGV